MNLKDLQAPFANNELEWRVGATNADKTSGIALAYLTNRAIQDRLDEVCGMENWKNEYMPAPAGGVMCGISIRVGDEWVTKWDGAENTDYEGVKGGLSDAMKRAAVQWGIGRYLYRADTQWVAIKQAGKSFVIAEPGKMVLKIDGKAVSVPSATKTSEETTNERPYSPDALYDRIHWLVLSYKGADANDTIQAQDVKNLQILAKQFFPKDDVRYALLDTLHKKNSFNELTKCEHYAWDKWLKSGKDLVMKEVALFAELMTEIAS